MFEELEQRKARIAVIGLGYVGLPLAIRFATVFDTVGIDINQARVERLKQGVDSTNEVSSQELAETDLFFSADPAKIQECRLIIVAVPTPVDDARQPDLTPLRKASETIGRFLRPGSVVVFESTVYPGVTEDFCGPIIEAESGLRLGEDFFLGYSPERVNPGDKEHTIDKIVKVVSGQNEDVAQLLARVYGRIVTAGIHLAPNIKTAEAAKVIENTQRDLNIALMNELALIFDKLDLDTNAVLAAAGTKWNFLRFQPGLVGGHCIGVDPYYLTHVAQKLGHHPQLILAGRRINDYMPKYVAEQTVKKLIKSGVCISGAKVLILGLSFKEDVPDVRNSKTFDIIRELETYDLECLIHDPFLGPEELGGHADPASWFDLENTAAGQPIFHGIVLAVKHTPYLNLGLKSFAALLHPGGVLVDVKGVFSPDTAASLNVSYWRL